MRLLIKIGSALISRGTKVNYRWLRKKISEIAVLHRKGDEIIIISSGAVAAGMEIEGLKERPSDILKLQLLSGEGQIKLMKHYKDYFKKKGIIIAQILLTHHSFAIGEEDKTVKQILNAYLKQGTIPIINENDLVNKEELEYRRMFTDNDILAGLVACGLKVDMALLLTDVDGLYRGNPKTDSKAELLERIEKISGAMEELATKETNSLGLGGMSSKIKAAKMMTEAGINVLIANGKHSLADIIGSRVKRTHFLA